MASKATTVRQRSSEKLIAAANTHVSTIEETMTRQYGAEMGAAARTIVTTLADALKEKQDAMILADDQHETELRDDAGIRDARDEAAMQVYESISSLRSQLKVICGPTYVKMLGISGNTPQGSVELMRLGETVVGNLKSLEVPKSLLPGFTYDPAAFQGSLAATVGKLKNLVSQNAIEQREAEATLMAKRQAIEEYDTQFSHAANVTSTLLRLSGETELAKRVRPSSRRPGQTAEQAPADGDTTIFTDQEEITELRKPA